MSISPLPSLIEIEINSDCNLSCSYCPNSVDERKEQGQIDLVLYEKLMKQLQERHYQGRIAFDFYNEPTLSKNFKKIVQLTKSHLPKSFISLYSNGTTITDDKKAIQLVDSGIDEIVITKHEELKKFPFQKVYQELNAQYKKKFTLKGFNDLDLTNRGGALKHIGDHQASNYPCHIPAIMMTVTVKGNVLPCFEDFYQTKVMGNINDDNIIDIWNSPPFLKFRKELLEGKRELHDICKNCNRVDRNMLDANEKKDKHLLGDEEVAAVSKVIHSGKLFRYQATDGECLKFEQEFSKKMGVPYSLMVTSGTNALVSALLAAGIGPGDEVIIPAYTFVATATAVLNVFAIPVIANIDEQFGISPSDLEDKITSRTKAVIAVHMDGVSADLENILEITKTHGLTLIEDACQAIGGKYRDQYLGTFGDYGCFSLNMDKIITCGDGGIVVTKTRENYEKLCSLSDSAFSFSPHHQDFFKEITPTLGYSMRVSEISGAIMRVQLKKLNHILDLFRERKKTLIRRLSNQKGLTIPQGHDENGDCGIALHLVLKDPKASENLGKKLRNHKIAAAPASVRPAHVAWKWNVILGERSHIHPEMNPYKKTDRKYNYHHINYLESIDIIMSSLRMDIDINWSDEETHRIADLIIESLAEV